MPPDQPLPVTGAAMDRKVPRRRGKAIALAAVALLTVLAAGTALWWWLPSGLRVATSEVRIATVAKGIFLDDIAVRANAEPLSSVMLDAVDAGRAEQIYAQDGALVEQGQLLFRLSNPQRNLELLARQAEHAQQISNLSNLRVAQEASRTDHERRLSDLEFALTQAEKQHARDVRMAERGFISQVALEESDDKLAQQRRMAQQERSSQAVEDKVRRDALAQVNSAINGLQAGLQVVRTTLDALAVRAPVAGRLTDFRLQVGETVVTGKHIGRIDDPRRFKLAAQVDEFYLNRVAVGRHASVVLGEQRYPAEVSALYPQIKDGRFSVELRFTGAQPPTLNPGQSLDTQITLGEPAPALLLPNGAFINDSGGAWVFALTADGRHAVRREIRIGRRNNNQIEVLAGLAAGERVIVSGYALYGKSPKLELTE
jgi:HlyD family secretion protein